MPEATQTPEGSSTSLEGKVNLLLALMMDERLFPGGELDDAQEFLQRLGIDLQIPTETRKVVGFLRDFGNKEYFLSREWVVRRLTEFVKRLELLENQVTSTSLVVQKSSENISRSVEMVTRLEERLRESTEVNREAVAESRESRKTLQDMASKYAQLQTDVSDIASNLKLLSTDFQKTAKDVEALNNAVANLQK